MKFKKVPGSNGKIRNADIISRMGPLDYSIVEGEDGKWTAVLGEDGENKVLGVHENKRDAKDACRWHLLQLLRNDLEEYLQS